MSVILLLLQIIALHIFGNRGLPKGLHNPQIENRCSLHTWPFATLWRRAYSPDSELIWEHGWTQSVSYVKPDPDKIHRNQVGLLVVQNLELSPDIQHGGLFYLPGPFTVSVLRAGWKVITFSDASIC